MMNKINDEFADMSITRQRRWALRHPDRAKAVRMRYENSPQRKDAKKQWYLKKKAEINEALDPDFPLPHLDPPELNSLKEDSDETENPPF